MDGSVVDVEGFTGTHSFNDAGSDSNRRLKAKAALVEFDDSLGGFGSGDQSPLNEQSARIHASHAMFDVVLDVYCSCSDLSDDGRYLAVGYWGRADIDLWNLDTIEQTAVPSPSRMSRVQFESTGNWLVYQSERGTYATSRSRSSQTRIVHADDLLGSAHRAQDNALLVPLRRKGQIAVVSFDPVAVNTVTLPIGSVIRCIRHSPKDNTVFIVDGTGCVFCYDDQFRRVSWRTPVKERPFDGAYCGDASLIGLHTFPYSGPPSVVVLDARSGDRVTTHRDRYCSGIRFIGDSVLQSGMYAGQILHLRDGAMEAGFASVFGVEYLRAKVKVT